MHSSAHLTPTSSNLMHSSARLTPASSKLMDSSTRLTPAPIPIMLESLGVTPQTLPSTPHESHWRLRFVVRVRRAQSHCILRRVATTSTSASACASTITSRSPISNWNMATPPFAP
ncbi:hypothetical protein EUGRSUZ_B01332 [Eucalyptus grandis]|uniref:Uncharacterized protein n=2 Tax=Eucalyptus grandis TaxID=71139 RepID=A0ACC3LQR3_EUCGR|nr:hypothetical protein EUGRSUZ_B01332 [Eucalyptus grandis]